MDYAYWLREAYKEASRSPDPSTANGAIIINRFDRIISKGCNTYHEYIDGEYNLNDRNEKSKHLVHAERKAIFKAARNGECTDGATIICPWRPCLDCAMGILDSGIKKIVGHGDAMEKLPDRWRDNMLLAHLKLIDAGIDYIIYNGKLDAPAVLFNGELWYP